MVDDYTADDLRDKVPFAQLLEAIQHVNVEPPTPQKEAASAVAVEITSNKGEEPAEREKSSAAQERPSAMSITGVDFAKTRASLGVNQMVYDPDHNYLDDLQTQRKRLHYPGNMSKTST